MKYILITGAGGGMGKSTVMLMKNKGYTVFALDKKPIENSDGIIPIEADLTDTKSIAEAFEKVNTVTSKLDAIIHFAGIYTLDSLVEMSEEEHRKIFDINYFGACLTNEKFLPLLKNGSKIIITTSELAPLDPLPFTGVYAITKAALDKYAYSLAMELQLLGIRVSVLRAGAVATNMLGVSTAALDSFCDNTQLYSCNATRFKKIVNGVETRNIPAEKISLKINRILKKKRPRFAYNINRNPLLLILNILPKRLQLWIIKQVLK